MELLYILLRMANIVLVFSIAGNGQYFAGVSHQGIILSGNQQSHNEIKEHN